MANVNERALAVARHLSNTDRHRPDETSPVPEERRAWCAQQLLAAHAAGERTTGWARQLIVADIACAHPMFPAPRDPREQPQLSLALV